MKNNELIKLLASYEHDRWSRWQKYLFSKCIIKEDGSLIIPKKFVDRWTIQMNTDYNYLSSKEKESDIKEAIRILELLKENKYE